MSRLFSYFKLVSFLQRNTWIYLLIAVFFGYVYGSDRAIRDNARDSLPVSENISE